MKRLFMIPILSLLALVLLTVPACAAAPPFFTQFPPGPPGSGAGQLISPNGIATNPVNHHIYVSEVFNRRINEFTAWGEFVKAFGWGVRDGSPELQQCTTATGCQAGLAGSGDGQFGIDPVKGEFQGPSALATDPVGNLYATDLGNLRVQKFNSDGDFLLTFGAGVNRTKVAEREAQEANAEPVTVTTAEENVCTATSGDQCGPGRLGTAPWELSIENESGVSQDSLTWGPDELLYMGDKDRIQAFTSQGVFDHAIPLPETGNPGNLAADPVSGDLYFTFHDETYYGEKSSRVFRLDASTGTLIEKFEPPQSDLNKLNVLHGLVVDSSGGLYVLDRPYGSLPGVDQFDSSGTFLRRFGSPTADEQKGSGLQSELSSIEVGAVSGGEEPDDLYVGYYDHGRVARIKVYGPVPDPALVGPPPKVPPTIVEQYASVVGTEEATLKAGINPHFWNDTTYFLQYGTGKCSEGGCNQEQPLPPGSRLTKKIVNEAITSQGVFLTGLEPGTTYHYRFVAQSSGSEGQPEIGGESAFTTRTPAPPANRECANQGFRIGPAALLPDCRAYEMVSPVEKNGADVSVAANVTGYPAGLDQLDPSGEELSYSVYRSFGDSTAGPYTSQYLAARDPQAGWSSHSITVAGKGGSVLTVALLDREYKAFSSDLDQGWLFSQNGVALAPDAPEGYANLYRRRSDGSFEAMVTVPPPATNPTTFIPELQGEGGECTVFAANDKLTEDAASSDKYQLYESCSGQLSLVSVLPTGAPAPEASVGTNEGGNDRSNRLAGAVSKDGSKIFWSNDESGPGKLFVRIDGSETLAITKGPAQFLAAGGAKAVYAVGSSLFEFTLGVNAKEKGTLIAGGFKGFLASSEDASRIYFLSSEVLDDGAEPGKPNLYLYEAGEEGALGSFTYVATLNGADAVSSRDGLTGPVRTAPFYHAAQASPDGGALLFDSVASLTGYDNTDARGGKPDMEAFLYRRAAGSLTCVSCDPSGARPSGREADLSGHGAPQWAAATIPVAQSSLYTPRALSADGTRAFFTSYVPLAQRDSNGAADVYQWEATGHGDCNAGSLGYDSAWEGCVNLISSGESAADSQLLDSGADGRDVFFKTYSSLLPRDPGLRDIYDARSGGGFPAPPTNPAPCEGEACQSPPEAPNDPTPASSAFQGAGNVAQPKAHKKKHKKAHKRHKRVHGKKRSER